ncbi:MAG: hypothetical protein SCAL_001452 [Candidatus Syntrophoarchaeum caldarius]|uniref:Uncharacterized protein n=1 Tax=Candidatus Syntropharchaeum caldarium TaxID=1838285 RepID=A0A1F2P8X0_9EURY|nr:MAG: hypothetical protein SCAL_001452 [Candidatus Syntrophoarchaeum caldarius]
MEDFMHEFDDVNMKQVANAFFYAAFTEFFGTDSLVFESGAACESAFNRFAPWFIEQYFPEEEGMDSHELIESLGLSEYFLDECEIGVEVDELEGIFIGVMYGRFKEIIRTGATDDDSKNLVKLYLADLHVPAYVIYKNAAKNADNAEKIFKAILEDQPLDLNAHHFLVELFKHTGQFEEARKEYQRLLKLIPEDAVILHNYAVFLTEMEEFEDARTLFEKAIELDPEEEVFRYSYENFLKRLGREVS